MSRNLRKVPATVVTGFLGSGKTTLLSNILKHSGGKRIAVIVNEFGELDVDADLLRGCPVEGCDDEQTERGIYELANGCICCTVQEEFLPVMKELVARRDEIDHILIETSGLALPKPLIQAFNWPEIKQHCTVDAVITVVDGPAAADGRFADDPEKVQEQRLADSNLDHDPDLVELFQDQLASADLVVINKRDLMTDEQQQRINQELRSELKDSVKIVDSANGIVSLDLMLGLEHSAEDRVEGTHTHHDHHHDHGHHHRHAHDDFDTITLRLGDMDSRDLQQRLRTILEQEPVYRLKGFVSVEGKPMRQVVQGVGSRLDAYFDRAWKAQEERKTHLVFIGKGLSKESIEQHLQA